MIHGQQRFTVLKEKIALVREILSEQEDNAEGIEEYRVQQQLDEAGLYVKQIAKDGNNVTKALSDALFFTQSRFLEIKVAILKFLESCPNVYLYFSFFSKLISLSPTLVKECLLESLSGDCQKDRQIKQ
jgi:hypothetical protein